MREGVPLPCQENPLRPGPPEATAGLRHPPPRLRRPQLPRLFPRRPPGPNRRRPAETGLPGGQRNRPGRPGRQPPDQRIPGEDRPAPDHLQRLPRLRGLHPEIPPRLHPEHRPRLLPHPGPLPPPQGPFRGGGQGGLLRPLRRQEERGRLPPRPAGPGRHLRHPGHPPPGEGHPPGGGGGRPPWRCPPPRKAASTPWKAA